MDSYTIYSCLDIIAGEPKTSVKVALLEEFLEEEEFVKVIKLAYDPLINYGILAIEPPLITGERNFDGSTYELLDCLAKRILTGNQARAAIKQHLSELNKESGELFINILNKDLRAGFSAKLINKAAPGTIETFPYMRCSTLKEVDMLKLDWKTGLYSQLKADGMFLNIEIGITLAYGGHDFKVFTRNGMQFPVEVFSRLPQILMPGYQYHGEGIVYEITSGDALTRKVSNGILNSILQSGAEALPKHLGIKVLLWDMVPIEDIKASISEIPYCNRFANLESLIIKSATRYASLIPTEIVHSLADAYTHFKTVTEDGYEGTVLKDPRAFWEDKTSRKQVKMKSEKECELEIVDVTEGKGKYVGSTGSVLCTSSDKFLEVNVSGFTDEERDNIWNNKENWIGRVITVKFNEVIDDKHGGKYSLFLPRFVEKREDKLTADTTDYILNL